MKVVVIFALIFLMTGLVSANHSISYDLVGDKSLVNIDFGEVSELEFRLPSDARTIESNEEYELVDFDSYQLLLESIFPSFQLRIFPE